jgi:hypothetical protein
MAINIEQTINKAANNTGRRWLGVDFNHMATTRKVYDAYFFLDTELDLNVNPINFSDHKANGRIRHCKVDPRGYYDYIANKTFRTLAEWAADCGSDIKHVVYGVNRLHRPNGMQVCVPLNFLLGYIGPVYDPVQKPAPVEMPDSQIVNLLKMKNLTLNNLYVIAEGNVTQWEEFRKL